MKKIKNIIWLQSGYICMILLIFFSLHFYVEKKINANEFMHENKEKQFKYHYVFICEEMENEFWQSIYKSMKEEGEKQDILVETIGEGHIENYSIIEQMKIAIATKADGIIVYPIEEGVSEYIEKAKEKGIPVITILNESENGNGNAFVGINHYAMGKEYGKLIKKRLEELKTEQKNVNKKIKTIILMDHNNLNTEQNRILSGIQEEIEIKEVELKQKYITLDKKNPFGAEEAIRDILISNHKLPDILICLSSIQTQCAYQSVVDYNQVGKVTIIGTHGTGDIMEALKKNIIYATVMIDEEELGKKSVQALYEYQLQNIVNEYQTINTYIIYSEGI